MESQRIAEGVLGAMVTAADVAAAQELREHAQAERIERERDERFNRPKPDGWLVERYNAWGPDPVLGAAGSWLPGLAYGVVAVFPTEDEATAAAVATGRPEARAVALADRLPRGIRPRRVPLFAQL